MLNVFLGGGQQRVRAKLYGALLYYLQIAHKPKISLAHLQGTFTLNLFARSRSAKEAI